MAAQNHIKILGPALVLFASAFLMLSGCVTTPQYECQINEAKAKTLDLATHYVQQPRTLAFGPLPRGILAEATLYRLSIGDTKIHPCQIITIHKQLYLRRNRAADLRFKETREFFAEDGTLIATNTEDLTNQLRDSGSYSAAIPLPIPRTAPQGEYLIVSRLWLQRRGDRHSYQLGRAEAAFRILPLRRPKASPH